MIRRTVNAQYNKGIRVTALLLLQCFFVTHAGLAVPAKGLNRVRPAEAVLPELEALLPVLSRDRNDVRGSASSGELNLARVYEAVTQITRATSFDKLSILSICSNGEYHIRWTSEGVERGEVADTSLLVPPGVTKWMENNGLAAIGMSRSALESSYLYSALSTIGPGLLHAIREEGRLMAVTDPERTGNLAFYYEGNALTMLTVEEARQSHTNYPGLREVTLGDSFAEGEIFRPEAGVPPPVSPYTYENPFTAHQCRLEAKAMGLLQEAESQLSRGEDAGGALEKILSHADDSPRILAEVVKLKARYGSLYKALEDAKGIKSRLLYICTIIGIAREQAGKGNHAKAKKVLDTFISSKCSYAQLAVIGIAQAEMGYLNEAAITAGMFHDRRIRFNERSFDSDAKKRLLAIEAALSALIATRQMAAGRLRDAVATAAQCIEDIEDIEDKKRIGALLLEIAKHQKLSDESDEPIVETVEKFKSLLEGIEDEAVRAKVLNAAERRMHETEAEVVLRREEERSELALLIFGLLSGYTGVRTGWLGGIYMTLSPPSGYHPHLEAFFDYVINILSYSRPLEAVLGMDFGKTAIRFGTTVTEKNTVVPIMEIVGQILAPEQMTGQVVPVSPGSITGPGRKALQQFP